MEWFPSGGGSMSRMTFHRERISLCRRITNTMNWARWWSEFFFARPHSYAVNTCSRPLWRNDVINVRLKVFFLPPSFLRRTKPQLVSNLQRDVFFPAWWNLIHHRSDRYSRRSTPSAFFVYPWIKMFQRDLFGEGEKTLNYLSQSQLRNTVAPTTSQRFASCPFWPIDMFGTAIFEKKNKIHLYTSFIPVFLLSGFF